MSTFLNEGQSLSTNLSIVISLQRYTRLVFFIIAKTVSIFISDSLTKSFSHCSLNSAINYWASLENRTKTSCKLWSKIVNVSNTATAFLHHYGNDFQRISSQWARQLKWKFNDVIEINFSLASGFVSKTTRLFNWNWFRGAFYYSDKIEQEIAKDKRSPSAPRRPRLLEKGDLTTQFSSIRHHRHRAVECRKKVARFNNETSKKRDFN